MKENGFDGEFEFRLTVNILHGFDGLGEFIGILLGILVTTALKMSSTCAFVSHFVFSDSSRTILTEQMGRITARPFPTETLTRMASHNPTITSALPLDSDLIASPFTSSLLGRVSRREIHRWSVG
jgi:hypothetical protein